MSSKKITFDDIATYTNFSKSTISRYFNKPDLLSEESQEIIRQALIDLNYHENKLARALANGQSEFVGIIIPNIYLDYYAEVLNQLLGTFEKHGYKFLVFLGDKNKEIEKEYIEELLAFNIEGLIELSHSIPSKELVEYNIPVITIEREDENINSINSDNYEGAVMATQHLINNGCDMLIHVNTIIPPNAPARKRIEGFEDTCIQNKVQFKTCIYDFGNSREETEETIKQFFDECEKLYSGINKGIFFANDHYAIKFLNLIFKKYGYLPDEYQLVGYDNSPIAQDSILKLTTVSQQISELTTEAMRELVLMMEERKKSSSPKKIPILHKKVKPKLIIRDTTKPLNNIKSLTDGSM